MENKFCHSFFKAVIPHNCQSLGKSLVSFHCKKSHFAFVFWNVVTFSPQRAAVHCYIFDNQKETSSFGTYLVTVVQSKLLPSVWKDLGNPPPAVQSPSKGLGNNMGVWEGESNLQPLGLKGGREALCRLASATATDVQYRQLCSEDPVFPCAHRVGPAVAKPMPLLCHTRSPLHFPGELPWSWALHDTGPRGTPGWTVCGVAC